MWQNDKRVHVITSVFVDLGNMPDNISKEQIDILEYYVKRLYSSNAKNENASLASERVSSFERSADNDLRKLPMPRPALVQHSKRSCYQAGFLWRECIANVTLPDSTLWGWSQDGKTWSQ